MAPLITFILLLQCIASTVTAGWIQESWSINTLENHFMGTNSGIADGTWPPNTGFFSTSNFVLRQSFVRGPAVNGTFPVSSVVLHNDTKCGTHWLPDPPVTSPAGAGKMPTEWVMCDEGRNGSNGFRFRFGQIDAIPATPANFLLEIGQVGLNYTWSVPFVTILSAAQAEIVTNPYGWITCVGGAPLTGVHCHLDGQITRFGYTEIKPSTIVKNETSPITSFPRRQSSSLKISPIQFLTTNFYKTDECQYDISFYVNDAHTSAHCTLSWPCKSVYAYTDVFQHCSEPQYSFSFRNPQWPSQIDGPTAHIMTGFKLDVVNTTCANGVKRAVTAGIDVDLLSGHWCNCDGYSCHCTIGDGDIQMLINRNEIVGPC